MMLMLINANVYLKKKLILSFKKRESKLSSYFQIVLEQQNYIKTLKDSSTMALKE